MKSKVAVLLLAVLSGVAYACTIVPGIVTPVIRVGGMASTQVQWQTIASKLDDIYGNLHQGSEILSVRVPVQVCFLSVCGVSLETQFIKPCGKTLKQAASEIAEGLSSTNGGSGGVGDGYGGVGSGGGGSSGGGGNCIFRYTVGTPSVGGVAGPSETFVDLVCT